MFCLSGVMLYVWTIGALVLGICLGGLITYKVEESSFKAMIAQSESLTIETKRLHKEQQEFNERKMIESIDDLPEYLKNKYDITEKQIFTEDDEDFSEIYI